MKLRTLIVDLDCPFGINHFQLLDCEECMVQAGITEKLRDLGATNPFTDNNTLEWFKTPADTGTYTIKYDSTTTSGNITTPVVHHTIRPETWTGVGMVADGYFGDETNVFVKAISEE